MAIVNQVLVSQRMHGAARHWLFAVLAGGVLAACSKPAPAPKSETASAKPPMAQSEDDADHHNDPCSLLQTSEVEGALGAPLGTPPYRGGSNSPAPGGDDCIYQTTNFQTVALSVDWDGGQQAYHIGDFVGNAVKRTGALSDKARQAMVSEDGSTIGGEWDEAKLTPFNCCIFNALRADQMISIDFTGSVMTLKAAAALVDAALKRMDKPLSLDGGANVAAAKTFLKGRPKPISPCSVLDPGRGRSHPRLAPGEGTGGGQVHLYLHAAAASECAAAHLRPAILLVGRQLQLPTGPVGRKNGRHGLGQHVDDREGAAASVRYAPGERTRVRPGARGWHPHRY